jgi:hypothetical protein
MIRARSRLPFFKGITLALLALLALASAPRLAAQPFPTPPPTAPPTVPPNPMPSPPPTATPPPPPTPPPGCPQDDPNSTYPDPMTRIRKVVSGPVYDQSGVRWNSEETYTYTCRGTQWKEIAMDMWETENKSFDSEKGGPPSLMVSNRHELHQKRDPDTGNVTSEMETRNNTTSIDQGAENNVTRSCLWRWMTAGGNGGSSTGQVESGANYMETHFGGTLTRMIASHYNSKFDTTGYSNDTPPKLIADWHSFYNRQTGFDGTGAITSFSGLARTYGSTVAHGTMYQGSWSPWAVSKSVPMYDANGNYIGDDTKATPSEVLNYFFFQEGMMGCGMAQNSFPWPQPGMPPFPTPPPGH